MLPLSLLPFSLRDGCIVPRYLTPRDDFWVRLLIDELDALVGRPQGDATRILANKSRQIASNHEIPIAAVRAVQRILERVWRAHAGRKASPLSTGAVSSPPWRIPSRKIRRVVFGLGRSSATPRDDVLRRAAEILGITPEHVSEGLFADKASERRLAAPLEEPSPSAIIDAHNHGLAQEFLLRSEEVTVHLGEHAALLLRVLKQRGLMYSFALGPRGAVITMPGPVSLDRQALRYGRALGGVLPVLTTIPDWSLDAKCLLGAKIAHFHADGLDPIVTTAPQDADNVVERWLFADFRRLGSRWSVAHATEPLRGAGFTFFPDFTFERGMDRVHLELIGFHTSEYVQSKLNALRNAELSSAILCIDDALSCSEHAPLAAPETFYFQKRIEVGKLFRALEQIAARRDAMPDSDQPSS